jgi:uncharacterized membrane protein YfcA
VDDPLLLAAIFMGTAVLYSSVGHAGASGYLAVMALAGLPQSVMKPTALVLNLFVASIVTVRFAIAGLIDWRRLAPFLVGSIPLAFIGGGVSLPGPLYRILVGIVLLVAAVRLFQTATGIGAATRTTDGEAAVTRTGPHPLLAVAVGATIGLLAGLTGTGGGIFLTPLLLFTGWATTRQAAGMTSAFVLSNSAAGLAGNVASVQALPPSIPLWVGAVMLGALVGSELGARRLATPTMRRLLSVVLVVAGLKLIFLP